MDEKAVKSYLIGYDCDERYRIWIKEERKVVLSRDVTFLEKPRGCRQNRCIPLVLNQGKEGDEREEKNQEKHREELRIEEDDEDAEEESTQ